MRNDMTRLGDLCEFRYGKSLPAQNRRDGPVAVYGSNGVVGFHDEAISNGMTIVIGRKGSIGEVNVSAQSCWPIDTTYYIDRDATELNINWLSRALSCLRLPDLNKAAAVPGLNRSDAYEKRLFVPRADEQRRIAAILDKADALLRKRKRALKLLDGLTQSIFVDAFGGRLTGPPNNFSTVDQIAELQNGAYFPSDRYTEGAAGVEMVHMSDAFYGIVQRGGLKRVEATLQEQKKYALLATDIIVARRSLNIEGAVKPCLIPFSEEPIIYESSFIRMRPSKSVRTRYLYHYMSSASVRKKFIDKYVTQSTISGINQSNLSRVPVLVPSLAEQDRFVDVMEATDRSQRVAQAHLESANDLFASLQQRAFSGQL